MADDLSRLDEWFGRIIAGLEPAQRRKATLKLGRLLRRSNLKRIGANVDPDGVPFAPRKARLDRRGRLRKGAGGKMFKGLRKLAKWRINAAADGVEIMPVTNTADRVGSVSQFGQTVTVGRLRNGRKIRAKYEERRLLGFSREDEDLALQVAGELLEPKGI
ncbi:phage virion morphogenesis protein [Novosphingobium sp. SG751A]|uniref:phage virion morphogenesis protein n=1 Tax=Novosphingobium sp. SG751A TaxID=2587000 RepID=UPI001556764F|nr:phage virion morphogenesis protein [Novosphingobium sp. SG751A]NOW46713.1 phage virion morphogenesis protein [Novosphingobium sp. SG751A]